MNSKRFKTFEVNGQEMVFDSNSFVRMFNRKMKWDKKKAGILEQEIADALCVGRDAVHAWRFKTNGPGGLDKIKEISAFFGEDDYMCLLRYKDGLDSIEEKMEEKIQMEYKNNNNIIIEEYTVKEDETDEISTESYFRVPQDDTQIITMLLEANDNCKLSDRGIIALKIVYTAMLEYVRHNELVASELCEYYEMLEDNFVYYNCDELCEDEYYTDFFEVHDPAETSSHIEDARKTLACHRIDAWEKAEKMKQVLQNELLDIPDALYIILERYMDIMVSWSLYNNFLIGEADYNPSYTRVKDGEILSKNCDKFYRIMLLLANKFIS